MVSTTQHMHRALQQQAQQQAAQQAAQQQGPHPSVDDGQRLRAQLAAAAGQGRALPPDVQAYIQQLQAQQAHQLHQHQVRRLVNIVYSWRFH